MDFKNKKIMIVVAHPDDELLGLGATMNRLINEFNVNTHVVILGEGLTSRSENRDSEKWKDKLRVHKKNIIAAQKKIGYHSYKAYDLPDNRFDTVPLLDIIKIIENEKKIFNPEIIFTHHSGDLNIDHQLTFSAVLTATRPLENEKVKSLITFETPSGTEWKSPTDPRHFLPNFFMKVSEQNLKNKIMAMESYLFEKRDYPHPRSPESLKIHAMKNGINIGCKFAEAFCIIIAIK